MDPTQKLIKQRLLGKKKDKTYRRYIQDIFRYDNDKKQLSLKKNIKENNNIYSNRKLYETVNELKDDLSSVENFDTVRKLANPFEYPRRISGENIDRAYIKIANIHYILPLFDDNKPMIKFADVAGGPGGWTNFIMDLCHRNKQEYEGHLITLNSEVNSLNWHPKILDAANMTQNEYEDNTKIQNIYISYGEDNTGDITKEENIEFFSKDIENSLDLVITDGGIGSDILQEQYHYKLFLAEIIIALKTLAIGGTYLMKVYDLHTEYSMNFTYLIAHFFDYMYIVKPISSRPANSERYIVAKGMNRIISENEYKYLINIMNSTVFISDLSKIVTKKPKYTEATLEYNMLATKKKSITKFIDDVPDDFKTYIMTVNNINGMYQRKYLEEIFICSEDLLNGKKSYSNGKSYDLTKSLVLWKVIEDGNKINEKIDLNIMKQNSIQYEIYTFEENDDDIFNIGKAIKDYLQFNILVDLLSHYIKLINRKTSKNYSRNNIEYLVSSFLLLFRKSYEDTVKSIYDKHKRALLYYNEWDDDNDTILKDLVVPEITGIGFDVFFIKTSGRVYFKCIFSGLANDILTIPISQDKLSNIFYKNEELYYKPRDVEYSIERMPKKDYIESLLENETYSDRLSFTLLTYSVYSFKYMFLTLPKIISQYDIEVELFSTPISKHKNTKKYLSYLIDLEDKYGSLPSFNEISINDKVFIKYFKFLFNPSPHDVNISSYSDKLIKILDSIKNVDMICVLHYDNGPSQTMIDKLISSNHMKNHVKYDMNDIRYYDNVGLKYKTINFDTEIIYLSNKE